MDTISKEKRSWNMSRISSCDTKPELFIRSKLHRRGYRFRKNFRMIEGCPDIYFTKKRIAIFVHGCFWHRHQDCKYAYVPKSNQEFWLKKFEANIARDQAVSETLTKDNIRVMIVWECTTKNMMLNDISCQKYLAKIESFIEDDSIKFIEL